MDGIPNPFLWWLATLSLVMAPILALMRRTTLLLPAAFLVAVLYFPWFATSRTSFLYYMTPVAPFMAILVAAALCAFAGTTRLPRYGLLTLAVFAVGAAVLWEPIGSLCAWIFWELPRGVSVTFGWVSLAVALVIALAGVVFLLLAGQTTLPAPHRPGAGWPRHRHQRRLPADRAEHPDEPGALQPHHLVPQLDLAGEGGRRGWPARRGWRGRRPRPTRPV